MDWQDRHWQADIADSVTTQPESTSSASLVDSNTIISTSTTTATSTVTSVTTVTTKPSTIPSASAIRIYQTPVQSLPEDLYIPPQAFAIWLEQFEGPLDFLLYLVKKNNFDLTDMAILPITEQYLSYIAELDTEHFELAGDYLLMASTLIAIKTELLLPKPDLPTDEHDPKAELIERLEAYAQIKTASARLDSLVRLERDVFLALTSLPSPEIMAKQLPNYAPTLLVDSLLTMQIKPGYQMHTIKADPIPLSARIRAISQLLSSKGSSQFVDVLEPSQGRLGVVVSFVAVLELIKRQWVVVSHDASISQPDCLTALTLRWHQADP